MAKTIEVKVPDIGDFSDVEIVELLVAEGDSVEVETPLISLESDKATLEVPSSAAGKVTKLKVSVGDTVSEGDVICEVEGEMGDAPGTSATEKGTADDEAPKKKTPETAEAPKREPETPKKEAREKEDAPRPAPTPKSAPAREAGEKVDEASFAKAHASPSVRRFARELGVDLGRVHGSGRKGRVVREDVTEYVKTAMTRPASRAPAGAEGGAGIPPIPEVDFSQFGETEVVQLPRIKKISGPLLHRSWLNIPHVTHHDEADITELDAFRKEVDTKAKADGYRITLLSFLMKASTIVLREMPDFNASLTPDGQSLVMKKYVHIGVAADTPKGLMVPVVKDVDKKGIADISKELGELSKKARDGKLSPKEMQGGCFSISSLGGIGGTGFTPIVNAPEVAILGVTRSKMQPVWDGSEFRPRLMLPLSLSYDHRVIDGAAAARFMVRLCELLEDARRMLL